MVWHETVEYIFFLLLCSTSLIATKVPVVILSQASLPCLGGGLQCSLSLHQKLTRLDCVPAHKYPHVVYRKARCSVIWKEAESERKQKVKVNIHRGMLCGHIKVHALHHILHVKGTVSWHHSAISNIQYHNVQYILDTIPIMTYIVFVECLYHS